ncbi:hypothetical protein HELRODRAFT_172158 [Helobdella robusta]|uniref:C-type lectin domain-containing protein n=1 Tax=Helobdella robusta TaxID=6412 RepID=T1F531_HELRO|nr:hypothetical protein HELRODRAFT_172158 [Helobdella robusta]ESO04511.1 hypothetical protein HELRODRAFT_172158 [Helobdella robusta]
MTKVIWTLFILALAEIVRSEVNKKVYSRAFSYLAVNGKKRESITNDNLRGINYRPLSKNCSCVLKLADFWYSVATDLFGGCMAFVNHGCPEKFDYIIENHKCFSMQAAARTWQASRSLCNNFLSSHPVVIESSNENLAVRFYSISVVKEFTQCSLTGFPNTFVIWTGSYITYVNNKRTSFLWAPYPTQSKPVTFTNWIPGEPNSPTDYTDYCVCYGLTADYFGWNDNYCKLNFCTVCEIDLDL